ncbi:MAG: hypothetical protein HKP58_06660, partial [Desulfatitalea sp.]|nr:hypothetical protein [Desulfatitalea sp.]NNK00079.1 hypothetical protein [Desulfatitalea sp.]
MNREISCRITNSIVKYVRDVHNAAVDQLLDDLPVDEAYLCDVHNWISHDLLQTLYQRMVTLLDDPDAVYKMTLASERFQPLGFLDRVVRLLGNPKFLYDNTYKYNRLLKTCGDVFVRESGPAWVVLEDCYHDGRRKTRYDCDYTRGILAGLPTVFGLPLAHVEELRCQVSKEKYGVRNWPDNPEHDGPGCLYRVHFGQAAKPSLW